VANNRERLDHDNGLLLLANLDIAFEQGFISFEDDGRIIISPELFNPDACSALTARCGFAWLPQESAANFLSIIAGNGATG
jgi:hypothetical protein